MGPRAGVIRGTIRSADFRVLVCELALLVVIPEPWRHLCRQRWWSWCPTANTRKDYIQSLPPQQAARGEQRRDPAVVQGRVQSKGLELSCLPWPVPAGSRAPGRAVLRVRASCGKAPARSHTSLT